MLLMLSHKHRFPVFIALFPLSLETMDRGFTAVTLFLKNLFSSSNKMAVQNEYSEKLYYVYSLQMLFG
jgi:hypothetical protein